MPTGKVFFVLLLFSDLLVTLFMFLFPCSFLDDNNGKLGKVNEDQEDLELPLFDLSTIASATDNFSLNNKLGEGGFGPVYRVSNLKKHKKEEVLLVIVLGM